jgi:spore coat protein U-like protein
LTSLKVARRKVTVATLWVLPFLHHPSHAATVTSTLAVRITVTASCVINSAATLNFGNHGVLTSNVDSTSILRVQCTNGTPYNIGLNAGAGSGATVAVRKMTQGSATINYSLYSDSGRTTVWGNTVGTNTVAGIGTGARRRYTVYGRVPAQTTPAAAVYTDTITITVTY